jgi:hypothetical protein
MILIKVQDIEERRAIFVNNSVRSVFVKVDSKFSKDDRKALLTKIMECKKLNAQPLKTACEKIQLENGKTLMNGDQLAKQVIAEIQKHQEEERKKKQEEKKQKEQKMNGPSRVL